MHHVEISIVVATCNSSEFIGPCLTSLMAERTVATEIIVVDNASTDRTREIVRTRFPQVTLLVNTRNDGHCRAINRGMAAARGIHVMVLDVDTVVQPGAVRHVIEFLRTRADVAVVAPRMLNVDGSLQETARRFPSIANALFGRQTLLTRLFPNNRISSGYLQRDRYTATSPFAVDWVSAACMVFRRSLIDRLGPWDEGFGGYWVDADWCARAAVVGSVFCIPAARVVHVEQNRRDRRRGAGRIVQFHQGVYRFYRKHYTFGVFDPRCLIAATALTIRAAVLVTADAARCIAVPSAAEKVLPGSGVAATAVMGKDER